MESANLAEKHDGAPKIRFYNRDLCEALKELLKNPKFTGFLNESEAQIHMNYAGLGEFSAFNLGKVFAVAQVYSGTGVSPIFVFLSSDVTLIGKRGGAHPIISEVYTTRTSIGFLHQFKSL